MANPYFSLVKAVWKNGKAWHAAIVGYYIAYIVAETCMSLSPYAFGKTIDILQNFKAGRLHEVIFWLVFGVVLVPLFWLFHGPARVVERTVALKIQQAFILKIYHKLTLLPLKWHQDQHSGSLITNLNRAANALKNFAEHQFMYIETIIKFIIALAFLFWISLPVGILSLVCCFLALFIVIVFDRKLVPLYESENEAENRVGSGLFDYISNITTVLTLRLSKLTQNNIAKRLLVIWPFFKKEVVLNEAKWFTMGMLISVSQSIILISYIVYQLKSTDTILIGTVVMIFRYQWDLSEVFYTLSANYSELVRMNTNVKGVETLLHDIKKLAHTVPGTKNAQHWQELMISNLCFAHPNERNQDTIHSLDLKIRRGEKIALIGLSGGGKSTLLNLLSGLYEPDQVKLTIDGREFKSLEALHAITTLIPQEPELFENTIAFNITMDLETEPDTIQQVMDLACFSSILEKLPQGLKTDIREKGLNLSVGQKQRLALARGLFAARFSSLVLMDEPTSSVDLATEKKILSGIINSYPDAAMVVSLHRLHLLPQFDRIIMLEHGLVVAAGATSQLLKEPGPVKDLWQKYQARAD